MTALTSVVEESTDHVLSLFLKMTSQSGNRIRVLGFMRVWLPRNMSPGGQFGHKRSE